MCCVAQFAKRCTIWQLTSMLLFAFITLALYDSIDGMKHHLINMYFLKTACVHPELGI